GAAVALHLGHLRGRARRIAAVAEHRVDGIETLPRAALRAVPVERNAEREDLAARHQPPGGGDGVARDVVERPDLVVGTPASPVTNLQRQRAQRRLVAHAVLSPRASPFQTTAIASTSMR